MVQNSEQVVLASQSPLTWTSLFVFGLSQAVNCDYDTLLYPRSICINADLFTVNIQRLTAEDAIMVDWIVSHTKYWCKQCCMSDTVRLPTLCGHYRRQVALGLIFPTYLRSKAMLKS